MLCQSNYGKISRSLRFVTTIIEFIPISSSYEDLESGLNDDKKEASLMRAGE